MKRLFVFCMCCAIVALFSSEPVDAQGLPLIRDAEIEDTIRRMSTPLFQAAGLAPSSVRIHIVADKSLNAFVADGQRMFMHTGLLMRAENASQIIGVIAHETGHISGGHLSRFGRAGQQGTATAVIATILGAATALGTGRPDIGAAVVAGGGQISQRNFFSFTRSQEGSADQAALSFLDSTGQSARGLLEFMGILENQELLITNNQDPYVRTHPLSSDRIRAIEAHIVRSPNSNSPASAEMELRFERTKAKLIGYFEQPSLTFRIYPDTDQSIPARFARAYAYSKVPDKDKALSTLASLLADIPDDPYFLELKAQVLFESGDVAGAKESFSRAVSIVPNESLIRFEYARALIASNESSDLEMALEQLKFALSREPKFASGWRNLGIAYGRLGDTGRSSLALAEEALLKGDLSAANYHAGRAVELFPRGSREWLQAEDLLLAAKNTKK